MTERSYIYVPRSLISVKDEMNVATKVAGTVAPYLKDVFLSKSNIRFVIKEQYILHVGADGKKALSVFQKHVPMLMNAWADVVDLRQFEYACGSNWVEVISKANMEFVKRHDKYFTQRIRSRGATFQETEADDRRRYGDIREDDDAEFKISETRGCGDLEPDVNVFRRSQLVGPSEVGQQGCGGPIMKTPIDMTVDDYRTLDVWRLQETKVWNKNFRYNNRIPPWQRTMNLRHYDRSNEGLRDYDYRNSSKLVPIRGYDMSCIHAPSKHVDQSWVTL